MKYIKNIVILILLFTTLIYSENDINKTAKNKIRNKNTIGKKSALIIENGINPYADNKINIGIGYSFPKIKNILCFSIKNNYTFGQNIFKLRYNYNPDDGLELDLYQRTIGNHLFTISPIIGISSLLIKNIFKLYTEIEFQIGTTIANYILTDRSILYTSLIHIIGIEFIIIKKLSLFIQLLYGPIVNFTFFENQNTNIEYDFFSNMGIKIGTKIYFTSKK